MFDSVFAGISAGRYPDLADRNSLWRLLCVVTRRKVIDRVHHERCQKRGGGAVRGESVFGDPAEGGAGFEQFAAAVEPPAFAMHLLEEMDGLFAALGDELRQVAQLRLEGRTLEEIGAETGCSARTVQRKLRQIRGLLAADAEPDEGDAES